MARASVPLNNYMAQQLSRVQGLELRVEDLAALNPGSLSEGDRQALTDVLRHALEGLSRYDKLAATISGLSPGASTLLRLLKGVRPGDYVVAGQWRAPFNGEDEAEAAASELAARGLIEIFSPPGRMQGFSAVTPTPSAVRALAQT